MNERRFDAPRTSDLATMRDEVGDAEPKAVEKTRVRSRKAALDLKIMGASFADIAKVLEFPNPGAARQAVEQAIIDSGSFEGDKESIRALMGLQLDQWHQSIARKIIDPQNAAQLDYMAMGLRLMERKARLFGVDSPTKVELHNAGEDEIAALIQAYQNKLGITTPVEADPFELVEGEDGVWQQADGMEVDDDDEPA